MFYQNVNMSGNPGEIGSMQTLCKQQSYIPFKLSFQLSRGDDTTTKTAAAAAAASKFVKF